MRSQYLQCKGEEWEKARMRALVRDDFTCQFARLGLEEVASCTHAHPENRLRKLQVHHLKKRINGGTHDDENLITICTAHHMEIHPHMKLDLKGGFSGEFDYELPEL